MIVKEFYETRDDNVNLYRTYSDTNHYIKQEQTNAVYDEAIDVEDAPYTYIETEDLIPMPEPTQEERNAALDIMMGQAE
jgi:hypothetical protein